MNKVVGIVFCSDKTTKKYFLAISYNKVAGKVNERYLDDNLTKEAFKKNLEDAGLIVNDETIEIEFCDYAAKKNELYARAMVLEEIANMEEATAKIK